MSQPEYAPPFLAASTGSRLQAAGGRYYLDGRPVLLRSAELQYFRVPAGQWDASIEKLKAAGFHAIASYIPWSWHEPEPDEFDFTGHTHPQRNFVGFLSAVRHAGMVFIARPGPFIYAEYRGFGYPEWLADRIPEALVRRPNGRPVGSPHYRLYSLLHAAYLAQVERWYEAVGDVLRPYVNSPVVAWQVDNETGLVYALRVGDLDFNPDTVARYRRFLRVNYEDECLHSQTWGKRIRSFDRVQPPGCSRSMAELADWQSFLERLVAGYLAQLRRMVERLDLGLPVTANEPAEYQSPTNPRLKACQVDFYGYDSYTKVTGNPCTTDFPFASSHHPLRFQQFASSTRPLSCWELGAGWWDWRAQVSPAATVQALGAGLAHGLKGYNVYVAQDGRDPGGYLFRFDGLLDETGQPTPRYDALARLQRFAAAHEDELTASVEVQDPIAYLDYQPYTRLMPEDCLLLPGLVEPWRYFANFATTGFRAVLSTAGYNVPFVDLQATSVETLSRFGAAVFPSRGYLDEESYDKVVTFVLAGGELITFPEPVTRTAAGRPLDTTTLWPHVPARARWLERARLLSHLIFRWMLPYYTSVRWKTAKVTPGALHLSDLIEPAVVGQAAPLRSAVLRCARSMEQLGGDLRLLEFPDGGDVLLRFGEASAGYRVAAGRGHSTLLGTIPGGAYVTSRYYTLPAETRLALRRFVVRLFQEAVPRSIVPDDHLEVETVARLSPEGGCLLFVINRLGAQSGTIRFDNPAALDLGRAVRAELLYSAFGSHVLPNGDGLALDLAADDVLAVRLR